MGFRPELSINIEGEPEKQFARDGKKRAEELAFARNTLRELIERAKSIQKKYYDQRHQPKSFAVGDWVTINSKNISTTRPRPKPRTISGHRETGEAIIQTRADSTLCQTAPRLPC